MKPNRCYWNGLYQATFKVVEYEVLQSETPTWWCNQFVGKTRQGLLITVSDETFLIDNEHGDGFYKVTFGLGSPMCNHKSVDNYRLIRDLEARYWNYEVNFDALKYEHDKHEEWLKENHPEAYKKSIALQKAINQFNKL